MRTDGESEGESKRGWEELLKGEEGERGIRIEITSIAKCNVKFNVKF